MKDNSWLKLHRKLSNWEWYMDVPVKVLFIHLLISANWKKGRFKGEEIGIGQGVTSYDKMSSESGISVQQARTAIRKLKSTGEISIKPTSKFIIYTVVNYSTYQNSREKSNIKSTSLQHDTNIEVTTIEERKNKEGKKEGKKDMSSAFIFEAKERWNTLATEIEILPVVKKLSTSRQNKIVERMKEGLTVDVLIDVLNKIKTQDFLTGNNDRGWHVTFDWVFVNDKNWLKIYEDNYYSLSSCSKKNDATKKEKFTDPAFSVKTEVY